ncbi:MAG: cytochrome c [Syntrophobacterales bacterium]|nr:cytochrome c [Syntrophobacterales bacterium]
MQRPLWLTLTVLAVAAGLALAQPLSDLAAKGKKIYEDNCADCHRSSGEGLPVKFPALKGNAFVQGGPDGVIQVLLNGRRGKMGRMPAWREYLSNEEIAAVASYIRTAWGNQAPAITPEQVAAARKTK